MMGGKGVGMTTEGPLEEELYDDGIFLNLDCGE